MPEGTLETILVVDDHQAVLTAVVRILEIQHFRVLHAESAAAALRIAEVTKGRIDLLLSDVHMPKMSGPDLGEALKKDRPDLRVMFMSGEPSGNLLILNYGWAFIQKPFVAERLVKMIRDVLDSPDRSQSGWGFNTRTDTQSRNNDGAIHSPDSNESQDTGIE